MNRWKIKINTNKSIHVAFALRSHSEIPLHIGDAEVPRAKSVKYLGMHLDTKLTWGIHIKNKCEILKKLIKKYYWLIGRNSLLTLENKRLIYLAIFKPIWTYGIALWGMASRSNIQKIQIRQNSVLRTITNAYRYMRNDDLHRDLSILTVQEEISRLTSLYEKRLHFHVNNAAIGLLDNSEDTWRLRRTRLPF